MTKLGVMIGSAPIDLPASRVEIDVETPWGPVSDIPQCVNVDGDEIFLIKRHGLAQDQSPHEVNYRANVWVMHQLGVGAIVGTHTVGGIDQSLQVGQLVLPDQLIDYTWGRAHTYDDSRRHVEFSYPYDTLLREYLLAAWTKAKGDFPMIDGGVYGCTQGPRLETAAEIARMRRDGCTVVGMTGMPEAALARELDVPYASVCVVVNPAAGMTEGEINLTSLQAASRVGAESIKNLLLAFLTI